MTLMNITRAKGKTPALLQRHPILCLVLASLSGVSLVAGTYGPALIPGMGEYLAVSVLPSPVPRYLKGVGNRLQTPGFEAITLTGSLTTAAGTGPAKVTWQLPGALRFEWPTASQVITVSKSGQEASNTALDAAAGDLIETFLNDRPEAFFYYLEAGAQPRMLGERFVVEGAAPGAPTYDIFQLSLPVTAAQPLLHPWKRYLFNSATTQLWRVEYPKVNGDSRFITTDLTNWTTTADGLSYPQTVTRTDDGQVTLTLSNISASVSSKLPASLFSTP